MFSVFSVTHVFIYTFTSNALYNILITSFMHNHKLLYIQHYAWVHTISYITKVIIARIVFIMFKIILISQKKYTLTSMNWYLHLDIFSGLLPKFVNELKWSNSIKIKHDGVCYLLIKSLLLFKKWHKKKSVTIKKLVLLLNHQQLMDFFF